MVSKRIKTFAIITSLVSVTSCQSLTSQPSPTDSQTVGSDHKIQNDKVNLSFTFDSYGDFIQACKSLDLPSSFTFFIFDFDGNAEFKSEYSICGIGESRYQNQYGQLGKFDLLSPSFRISNEFSGDRREEHRTNSISLNYTIKEDNPIDLSSEFDAGHISLKYNPESGHDNLRISYDSKLLFTCDLGFGQLVSEEEKNSFIENLKLKIRYIKEENR